MTQLEDLRDSDEVIKLVNEQLENCLKKIEKEIAMIFYRFSENNEIDYDLAIKLLTGKEYIKFKRELTEYMELIDTPNILLELNTLAARSRISRLEQSFFEIQKHIDGVFQFTDEKVERLLYESTKSNYYKTLFDVSVASGVTVKNLNVLSKAEIVKEFAKPWSGKNFSERIWKNRTLLKDTLEEIIIQSAIQGVDTEDAIDKITKKIDVSKKAAATLIYTEQAYFSGLGTKKAYEAMNVQKYIYIATLDIKTSDTCRELDHEIFSVSEAQAGVNYPPMHPRCRSATAPYTGKLEGTRTARDKDGNEVKVDKSLNYHEWYKKYVESNPEYLIEEKKWKNRHSDKKQLEKYRKLSNKVPRKLEDFQNIKYNESRRMNLQLLASKDLLKQTDKQIAKGIKSNIKQIEKHKAKVLNPHLFDPEFNNYTDKHKEGLVRHWKKEIKTFEKNIEDSIEELEKRGVDVSEWKNK
ncbi:minor capsid protein [Peptostreptococcus sp. D1]|uniref:minor capsid protein n=1 Tax=Peptostreptococcus sp. D1 TaxID=72304 RepID=UPI0008E0335E|nr:minor capsid protein [Peptostreptococcus sp. D1]SFE47431.1 phage putative head morphogenesis protein, SPP1 gp7 family [Peptostreptococcus sp. D1]